MVNEKFDVSCQVEVSVAAEEPLRHRMVMYEFNSEVEVLFDCQFQYKSYLPNFKNFQNLT